jgi:hypothetical protein
MAFARNFDPNKVDRVVLSPPYSTEFTAPNGEDAFKPVCNLILPQIAKMFALGNNALCNGQADTNGPSPLAASATIRSGSALDQRIDPLRRLGQMAKVNTASLPLDNGDIFVGVRSLLDLLCVVSLESIAGAEV